MKNKKNILRSMTGFGEAGFASGPISFRVQVHSVNHKFLDISIRLPGDLSRLETEFRETARSIAARGRISVTVEKSYEGEEYEININREAVSEYIRNLQELSEKFGFKKEADTVSIFSLPGAASVSPRRFKGGKKLEKDALNALKKALRDLDSMRASEGENLKNFLKRSLDLLSKDSVFIEKRADLSFRKKKSVLEKRVKDAGGNPSEGNFASEIVNMANRLDITEETDRLNSHIKQFGDALSRGPSGIKLEFILQEMLRETNTIAAKSQDILITKRTIEMKTGLQKIKEQVQNVE